MNRELRFKLALLSCSSILAIGAAELLLRAGGYGDHAAGEFLSNELATPELFVSDSNLFWKLNPANDFYDVSPRSTRGWCPDEPPGPGEYRIALIGDSCVFGLGVRYDQCFGVRFARALQSRLDRVSVEAVLEACPGYSSFQSLRWLEQSQPILRPDLTILYCGAWNDYVPAVATSDAERSTASAGFHSNLAVAQVIRRAVDRFRLPNREQLLAQFRSGRAPNGRRVPLDDFRANLREIIRLARNSSESVLVVVPPLPAVVVQQYPIALEYRDAMRQVATQESVLIVDAAEIFERTAKESSDEWIDPAEPASRQPLFKDWVHPSALGHEWIAQALTRTILAHCPAKLGAALTASDSSHGGRPAILSVEPASIPALQPGSLTLEMTPAALGTDLIGVWIGDSWIDSKRVTVVGRSAIRVELPGRLPAGRLEICGVSRRGPIRGSRLLEVTPLLLEAQQVDQDEQSLRISLELTGRPRSLVRIWGAPQLLDVAVATEFGDFSLAADPDGRSGDLPDRPFRFERLKLACFFGQTDETGHWRRTITVPRALVKDRDAIYFQGLLTRRGDLTSGSLTSLAVLHPLR